MRGVNDPARAGQIGFLKMTALLLVWVITTVVVLACAFSGFIGRASWGDGKGPSTSTAGIAGLIAIAVVTVATAIWLTRIFSRHG